MIVTTYHTENKTKTDIYCPADYNIFKSIASDGNHVIITDEKIYKLYSEAFVKHNCIIIKEGEANKNLSNIENIIQKFVTFNIDRDSLIIGFGGGLVCDIAGFAASIYMRGTPVGFVATTLLAQIDAAIGGKNGVNFNNYKNYIGNISQPQFVICDATFFKTLSNQDYMSGLGEVLKYCLISNTNLIEYFISNYNAIKERDKDVMDYIVKSCVKIKTEIVSQDTNDKGLRHILNFGHSFGHCYEIIDGLAHGIAVAKGICTAVDLSLKFGYTNTETNKQIKGIIKNAGFETEYKLDERHFDLLHKDKKKTGDYIDFVFLTEIGNPIIIKTPIDDIIKAVLEPF
ncbi:MAG: 3-dehydroquinate synthase [Bacteroidales bacterium]|nr:3-dehydroquinate synthase [Bacteroidales bacterium]